MIYKTLKYPKSLGFTKKQVMGEIKYFRYPKAWKYSEDKHHHFLHLHTNLIRKYYPDFKGVKPKIDKSSSPYNSIKIPRFI